MSSGLLVTQGEKGSQGIKVAVWERSQVLSGHPSSAGIAEVPQG